VPKDSVHNALLILIFYQIKLVFVNKDILLLITNVQDVLNYLKDVLFVMLQFAQNVLLITLFSMSTNLNVLKSNVFHVKLVFKESAHSVKILDTHF
jgi:hypothetical protein